MAKPEPGWGALFSGANAVRSPTLAGGTALRVGRARPAGRQEPVSAALSYPSTTSR
ncbi:hypothetical protein ACFW16_19650 [Inquilinus sp. NPDC058860]|uniref:hypothetical protein n=1 Tax=Inquilinus sp. NPDC058860 TaxID=3346652 RepID=UPI0036A6C79F